MAKQRRVSDPEAIKRAREELGEKNIAILRELSAHDRDEVINPKEPVRRGGRPKGTGMDFSGPLRRMAELQEADSALSNRETAERVRVEWAKRNEHFSAETLRKAYGSEKERLIAAVRESRKKRISVAVILKTPENVPTGITPPPTLRDSLLKMVESAERRIARLTRPAIADLMKGTSIKDVIQPYIEAEKAAADFGRAQMQAQASMRELSERVRKSSEEALRGLELLLGQKPKL